MEFTIQYPQAVQMVHNRLKENGYESFIVGGCVRDSLLGKAPHDWDMTTNALPDQIKECFPDKPILTVGLDYGTVTVIEKQEQIEITTYRKDGEYTDNRKPDSVSYATDLATDLERRDFTMNAMAYSPETGLIDLFGGVKSLENKTIRCVGDAEKRFQEDALRILRAIRFSSVLGFSLEEQTKSALHTKKELLSHVSRERIQSEFMKILMGKHADAVLMEYPSVLEVFLPEIKGMIGMQQNNPYHCYTVWEHTVKAVSFAPDSPILKLVSFFHDIGKPSCYSEDEQHIGHFIGHPKKSAELTDIILKRLHFPNDTIKPVVSLIAYHDYAVIPTKRAGRRLLNLLGEEITKLLFQVQKADALAQSTYKRQERLSNIEQAEQMVQTILEENQCFSIKDLAITGNDLLAMGIKKGPEIGILLQELLSLVMEDVIQNEKESLLKAAESRRKDKKE